MNATARARTRVPEERAVVPEGMTAAGAQQPGVLAAGSDAAQLPARIIARGDARAETDRRGLCGLIVRAGDPDVPRGSTPHPALRGLERAVSHDALPAARPGPARTIRGRAVPPHTRRPRAAVSAAGVPGPRRTKGVRLWTSMTDCAPWPHSSRCVA